VQLAGHWRRGALLAGDQVSEPVSPFGDHVVQSAQEGNPLADGRPRPGLEGGPGSLDGGFYLAG